MIRFFTFAAFILVWFNGLGLIAQVQVNYSFSSYSGVFTSLTNPTHLVVGNYDDQAYVITGLPDYQFNGSTYDALTVHSNGCVIPGNIPSPGVMYLPLSAQYLADAVISPLGRDLQSATSASTISYEVTANEIVIQWLGAKRFGATGESFDFQIRIDLLSNAIRFVYGTFSNVAANGGFPQVGLRGASPADYLNRSVVSGSSWTTSAEGDTNTATCTLNNQAGMSPEFGLTYVFSQCDGVLGCMDAAACNYDPLATCSNGSCTYCDCESNTCGCLDANACNYNLLATYDDGSCAYNCYGCTNPQALNYNVSATVDDGSCYLAGSGLSCDSAIELTCGMTETIANTTLIETVVPYSNSCGMIAGVGYWYAYTATFSSSITVSTVHPATDFDTYIMVYSGTCGALQCEAMNDDGGGNFQSIVTFEAVAGATYYIHMRGFGTQTGTYGMTFDCGGGCLDPEACNYDADAPFDNGSCLFGADCYGCTDAQATNYNAQVVYDDGSCTYTIDLVVFYDINADGERQPNEPGMANWPLYIGGLQATLYTNANGRVDVTVPASPFLVELFNTTDNWVSTTPSQQMVVVPSNGETLFGLAPSTGEAFVLAGPIDGFWDIIHCTEGREDGVFINNTGSVALNGTITLVCDELFTPEADVFGTVPPDATGPGFAQWNIVELLPGQNQLYSFHIDGPGFDVIGDNFTFLYNVVLYDADGVEFFNTEYETSSFVACSYDPNDIAATPEGYEEPHFILTGERIQYRIRFQNTGNLPAEDVVIIDDLDPTVFDMSTFTPLYGSASFTSCLHDDGTLDFIFNEINLPDSASDEEGSHGFVVFSIELQPDLAPGTVINNYADIYFEQNPAITTNTVFHTIFDCGSLVAPSLESSYCSNETVVVDNTQDYVESYAWVLDGESTVTSPQAEWSNLIEGVHELEWSVENPLCTVGGMVNFDVLASPELEVASDAEVCIGSDIVLNANSEAIFLWNNTIENGTAVTINESQVFIASATSENGCSATEAWAVTAIALPNAEVTQADGVLYAQDGVAWQWYLNGEVIEGATSSTLSLFTEGAFAVLVTNTNGCSAMSEDVLVGQVAGADDGGLILYPQPITGTSVLLLPSGKNHVDVLDASGRVVKSYGPCMDQLEIEAAHFAAGVYFVHVKNDHSAFTMKTIIE